jgi:hypothetical protein
MKRAEATLEKIYERDPVTNAYIIAVALEKYADIFNELDPSPFRKRDLDNDLRVFLEHCSSDIPLNQEIILQFNLTNEAQDKEKEEGIRQGLRTYFSFTTSLLSSEIWKSYEKSAVYAGVSFVLLFVSYSLRTTIVGNPLYSTLIEGISISCWVFCGKLSRHSRLRNEMLKTRGDTTSVLLEHKYASTMFKNLIHEISSLPLPYILSRYLEGEN